MSGKAQQLKKELELLKNPTKAAFVARHFKTGPGEYGEGDIFWGITVPVQRQIAKKYKEVSFTELQQLIHSPIHEFRLTGLLILVEKYKRAETSEKEKIVKLYLKNILYVNNWDLVDTSAPYILGDYYFDKDTSVLYDLCRSPTIWQRRVAIISTQGFIRRQQFTDTLNIATLLLSDSHDLIHKAVGWMLREVGKKDRQAEMDFLDTHSPVMPRTMLRYAIEKFDETTRQKYLKTGKKS